jgi:phage terminase large subunit
MPTIQLPANGWRPRDYQVPAWASFEAGCKRQLLIWHRRAGKDEINLQQHAVSAFQRIGTYWHMLPQFAQARKAIWDAVNPRSGRRRIDEAFPHELRDNTRDHDMFIRFKNGSTWQAVGSDNYDSLVGTPPIGLTASEWALANPTAWGYLAPILAENNGWASFITTPRGNNHVKGMHDRFKNNPNWFVQILTANDTGAIDADAIEEQRGEYEALFGKEVADMLIEQEFFCSFAGAMLGAYWGAEITRAERAGRIRVVPVDPRYPVNTAWDLGKAVNNPIWCFQVIPVYDEQSHTFIKNELRIVDFYRPDSDDLEEWCAWLNERNYHGDDYVPHDVMDFVWGAKHTRWDLLKAQKRKPKLVGKKSVAEGINAGREAIKAAVFDADRCELGVDGLKNYRREWDDELKTFRENPVKDWAEHIGSSWRYLGLAWRDAAPVKEKPVAPKELQYAANADGSIVGNMSVKAAVDAMVRRRRARE